jgi:hypothetical protein
MRTRRIVECTGSLTALLVASWGIYLELVSNGTDPTVMRWFGTALIIFGLTWLVARFAR